MVWDVVQKKQAQVAEFPVPIRDYAISVPSQNNLLAVPIGWPRDWVPKGQENQAKLREVRFFSFPDLKDLGKIENERYVSSAVLSPNGQLLAMLQAPENPGDWEVVVWDVASRKPKFTLSDVRRGGGSICFSPDGKRLAVPGYAQAIKGGGIDRTETSIQEYDPETGRRLNIIAEGQPKMTLVDFDYSPDGKEMVARTRNTIRAYDLAAGTFRDIFRHRTPENAIRHWQISPDKLWLVIGHDDRDRGGGSGQKKTPYITIWDLQAEKTHRQFPVPEIGKYMSGLALSSDKKTVAVSGGGGLYLYDLAGK